MSERPYDRPSGPGPGSAPDIPDASDPAERLLAAAFDGRPVPELSGQFDALLRRRLEAERARMESARRRWRWLLAVYWLVAVAGIVFLVDRAGLTVPRSLPPAAWGPVLAALVLTLAGIALPLTALANGWSRTTGLPRRFSPRSGL